MNIISLSADNILSELSATILIIGVAVACLTFLFPTLAVLLKILGFRTGLYTRQKIEKLNLEVLVLTYKENNQIINSTLESILKAVNRLNNANIKITVLVDPQNKTTYNSVKEWVLNNYINTNIVEAENTGKWNSIVRLVDNSNADWCALVDAGTIWDLNILTNAAPLMKSGKYLGIAPTYDQIGTSVVHKIHWKLERILKKIENYAGGPCSVHGATVFYDTRAVKSALKALSGSTWYNDDVVIPLYIRTLGAIRYDSTLKIYDGDAQYSLGIEHNRRQRMMLGNIQWISKVLPQVFKKNIVLGVIALRRVVRVFWSYSLIFALVLVALNTSPYSSAALVVVCLMLILMSPSLKAAFMASIRSANYIRKTPGVVTWS